MITSVKSEIGRLCFLWFFVVFCFMILQLNQLWKCSIASKFITLVRPFPCVRVHVSFKVRLESKSALTYFAFELLHCFMYFHMLFQSLFGWKPLSTVTACKWFLFNMTYSHVLLQLADLSKIAFTYLTLVRFCFMDSHVSFQIPIVFFTQVTPSVWITLWQDRLRQVHYSTVGLDDDCFQLQSWFWLFEVPSISPPVSHLKIGYTIEKVFLILPAARLHLSWTSI